MVEVNFNDKQEELAFLKHLHYSLKDEAHLHFPKEMKRLQELMKTESVSPSSQSKYDKRFGLIRNAIITKMFLKFFNIRIRKKLDVEVYRRILGYEPETEYNLFKEIVSNQKFLGSTRSNVSPIEITVRNRVSSNSFMFFSTKNSDKYFITDLQPYDKIYMYIDGKVYYLDQKEFISLMVKHSYPKGENLSKDEFIELIPPFKTDLHAGVNRSK